MSIPRVDPAYTTKKLHEEAELYLAAGKRYWEAMAKAGMGGAIAWIKDTEGFGCVFTRGEYTDQLLRNIDRLGTVHHFGCMKDE